MARFDQTFSSKNFNIIFDLLNRQGKIDSSIMPIEYQRIIEDLKENYRIISSLKRRKSSSWTSDEEFQFEYAELEVRCLLEKKRLALEKVLSDLEDSVSNQTFRFSISKHIFEDRTDPSNIKKKKNM